MLMRRIPPQLISLVGITAIVIIELQAIQAGLDGWCLAVSFSCIGGIAGYNINKRREKE